MYKVISSTRRKDNRTIMNPKCKSGTWPRGIRFREFKYLYNCSSLLRAVSFYKSKSLYSLQVTTRGLVCTGMDAEVLLEAKLVQRRKRTNQRIQRKASVLQKLHPSGNNEEEEDGN